MRVKSVRIEGVRGISGPLTLNMTKGANSTSRSLLLYGENGSGKSSVVDGIEFALRGVVSRRGAYGKKDRREIRRLFPQRQDPSVSVVFDNGEEMVRGASRPHEGQKRYVGRESVSGFGICPVVIRRRDIDGFWSSPPETRQNMFFDYLRTPGGEFLDEERRQESIDEYNSALLAHEEALSTVQNLLPDWDMAWPERTKGLEAVRIALRNEYGKEVARPPISTALETYRNALARRNHAAAAGKPAMALGDTDRSKLQHIFESVAGRVASDFRAVTGENWITDVAFDISSESELNISLVSGSTALEPTQVLSEALLDLLALLIFVEVHIECAAHGQKKILVLDDVFQSVDRSLRMRTLEHLALRLSSWQMVITLHDRLWLELADRALTAAGVLHMSAELKRSQIDGSTFVLEPAVGPLGDLLWCLNAGASETLTASAAGRALEATLEEATQFLHIPIKRNIGDRYTINELWEPLAKVIKVCASGGLRDTAVAIDGSRFLRNLIGAHYNESMQGISAKEIEDFARLILTLRNFLTCSDCGTHYEKGHTEQGKWSLKSICSHPVSEL